jgi:AraC family ethanolamine operon transcriptional activator
MMRQNPKKRVWAIADVDLGDIKVQYGQLGSGNIVEGQSAADTYILYMPLTDACDYTFNGLSVRIDEFAILEPNSEFRFSTKVEHDFCLAVVSARHFAFLEELPYVAERPTLRVTRGNRQSAKKFRQVLDQILTSAASCPQFESEVAARHASETLVRVASTVVAHQPTTEPPESGRPRVLRKDIIDRSMALLENRNGEPVSVADLATAARVSERTLRRAFKECFGVGPVRYLQLRRLHLINRALRAADPVAASVTGLLARYGEWEFGRFASRYRRLFDELPSETLRKSRH